MDEPADRPERSVLCVGVTPCLQRTLFFDTFACGEVNRAAQVLITASGKATNVARVIHTLGNRTLLTGFLGGPAGTSFLEHLQAERVPSDFVATAAPTRICQTLIDRQSKSVTELVEEAALPSPAEWNEFVRLFLRLAPSARCIVISGSPPPGAPPTVYRDLLASAASFDVPVVIDAQKEPMRAALVARPFLAKLNREELGKTLNRPLHTEAELAAAAAMLRDSGAQRLVVTDGRKPAWLFAPEGTWTAEPPPIEVLNPIGSGDAMTAGLVLAFSAGQAPPAALAFGVACGAANALTATSGVVDPNRVYELLPHVRVSSKH